MHQEILQQVSGRVPLTNGVRLQEAVIIDCLLMCLLIHPLKTMELTEGGADMISGDKQYMECVKIAPTPKVSRSDTADKPVKANIQVRYAPCHGNGLGASNQIQ